MSDPVNISEAESIVMEVLWHHGPMRSENVVETLAGQQKWREPTIKTLLSRLLTKGAIRAEKEGPALCLFSRTDPRRLAVPGE